ncbi:MAG: SHOCT domain-containing protein, partial [Micrococcales bacterium]|nr:SHOCT domain-containing protein [Micrococcales bacterium]
MMWGNGYGMAWSMWLVMGASTLAFWVLVLLVVRTLLFGARRKEADSARPDPLTLLKEGLARG